MTGPRCSNRFHTASAESRQLPRKEYVNGEGFLYLGRSYRLKRAMPDYEQRQACLTRHGIEVEGI